MPYAYGGSSLETPTDTGALFINFALFPRSYQPSGHINVSRAREFYIQYFSSYCTSNTPCNLIAVAVCINFLLVTDGLTPCQPLLHHKNVASTTWSVSHSTMLCNISKMFRKLMLGFRYRLCLVTNIKHLRADLIKSAINNCRGYGKNAKDSDNRQLSY